jgi:thiol-disulfide isomerase/thioredoxin
VTPSGAVTPARFASGRTFAEWLDWIGSPENLAREASGPGNVIGARRDWSGFLRERYARTRLTDAQAAAARWLAAQPGGPAKVLVVAEDWSSDCRRDLPVLARLAEAGGLELRVFDRDGKQTLRTQRPDPADAPDANWDLMLELMNEKNGQQWASIPVAVFYDRDLRELYRYVEYPAIYHKDRVVGHLRAPRPGETAEQTKERGTRAFMALLESPFFDVWGEAAVDEILSALHERLTVGSL